MSRYKYVTPNWNDTMRRQYDQDNSGLYTETFITTQVYILNNNAAETSLNIYFYTPQGEEHIGLRIADMKLPSNNTYSFRVSDLIYKMVPNYINEDNFREGWLKIVSSEKLAVTGTMTTGTKGTKAINSEICCTIPFFESLIEDIGIAYEPIDTGHEPIDPKGWKIPRPFPK